MSSTFHFIVLLLITEVYMYPEGTFTYLKGYI